MVSKHTSLFFDFTYFDFNTDGKRLPFKIKKKYFVFLSYRFSIKESLSLVYEITKS